jgi:hypothetical protein
MLGRALRHIAAAAPSGPKGIACTGSLIIDQVELSEDERDDIEDELGVVEDEAAAPQPRAGRIRRALGRLSTTITTGALSGVEEGTKDQISQLMEAARGLIG